MQNSACINKKSIRILVVIVLAALALVVSTVSASAASTGTVTAQIKPSSGAIIRSGTSTKSSQVGSARQNATVVVDQEVFLKKKSTAKKNRWYHVTSGGTSGYIRADLLKNFSYTGASFKVTKKTNYRTGAGTKMKKKGTLKKGTVITAVLPVKAKGSSKTWYKFKKGSKYLYVADTNLTAIGGTAASAPTYTGELSFSTTGIVAPSTIYTKVPFAISGQVTSTHPITGAQVGVTDTAGNWIIKAEVPVNSNTFNIASVDSKIAFGTLSTGSYVYKVDVAADGMWFNQVTQNFTVNQATAPQRITETALYLAWPRGTSSSAYKYGSGSATPQFTQALHTYYPTYYKWGAGPKVGASCDVFVGTVMRASGYDPDFPRGHDEQWAYLPKSPRWQQVSYSGKAEELQSGDIITYLRKDGGCHVCLYYKAPDGKNCLIEAKLENCYGYVNETSSGELPSKATTFSNKKSLRVYRATS